MRNAKNQIIMVTNILLESLLEKCDKIFKS